MNTLLDTKYDKEYRIIKVLDGGMLLEDSSSVLKFRFFLSAAVVANRLENKRYKII